MDRKKGKSKTTAKRSEAKGSAKVHSNGFACTCDLDSREYKSKGCYCGVAEMEMPVAVHANGFACTCDVDSREYRDKGCYCGVADMEVPAGQLLHKPQVKVCYNCGEPGHMTAACSKPRTHNAFKGKKSRAEAVCRKCQEKGHMSFECKLKGIKKESKARRDWLPSSK
mmetsp:Transcript_12626/g.32283  ORF Transcript_12626/g.32283 Transcript_12626/m.32283 type:complete len:168 (+) Transcript_12626:98-601(+)